MIIIRLKGGLGNQLFQYSFLKYIQKYYDHKICIDLSHYSNDHKYNYPCSILNYNIKNFDILKRKYDYISNKIIKYLNFIDKKFLDLPFYVKDNNNINDILENKRNIIFDGYWQNYRRYLPLLDILRKEFTPRNKMDSDNKKLLDIISSSNSISIHIRKGRYLYDDSIRNIYPEVTLKFYKEAVNRIEKKVYNPTFFIFSNDNDWVIDNFDMLNKEHFILLDNKGPDYEHLYLMRKCKHNIITNSTFSWWGAWLNNNPAKIVITPKDWEIDYARIPVSWVRLKN